MAREDVEEVILKPMQRLYLPPKHLRYHDVDDPEAKEEALGQYVQALERFDGDTLERAWQRVRARHEFSIWPTPAKIVQAAEIVQPKPLPPSETERKRQQAWQDAQNYANQFLRRRKVGKLAREQGWSGQLYHYVQAAGFVQAQLIAGLSEEGIILPTELTREHRSSAEALQALRRSFARPITEGAIDVKVPEALIEQWRSRASPLPRPRAADLPGRAG